MVSGEIRQVLGGELGGCGAVACQMDPVAPVEGALAGAVGVDLSARSASVGEGSVDLFCVR